MKKLAEYDYVRENKMENTVLILGAGASVDYGFPTGHELSDQIGNSDSWTEIKSQLLQDQAPYPKSCRSYERGFNLIERHFFGSRNLSIDSWLDKDENLECVGAAKIIIAHLIAQRENSDFSRRGFFSRQYDNRNRKPDWYQLLFNALSTNKFEDFPASNDKLTIVTFNYDRSLEFYLSQTMQNTYPGHLEEDCWNKLKSLNIKHVYGSVGDLPVANPESGVSYGSLHFKDYMKRIKNLKLIPEMRDEDSATKTLIHEKLQEAQNVFFVGFSYDRLNLELLSFPITSKRSRVYFLGSVFGMEDGEIIVAQKVAQIRATNSRESKFLPVNENAYTFFRRKIVQYIS